jgi:teichuronic acid biosynthesis glycosyltransferase TuaG
MPKVSVIITTYNRANLIREAVESVINQTFTDWELFIIDDGSTDNTANVVSEFLRDARIKYFMKENGGVSSALNWGLKLSTGKYIAFLDSDDKWLPEKLESQVKSLDLHADIDTIFTPMFVQNLNENISSVTANKMLGQRLQGRRFLKYLLLDGFTVMPSTVLIRHEKVSVLFDEELKQNVDFGFFMELGLLGLVFYGLKYPLAVYRKGQNSITSNRHSFFKNALKVVNVVYKKNYVFSININIARSYRCMTFAKYILRSSTIKYGRVKKILLYISTLAKSFYYHPLNFYLYKHLLKDLPKRNIEKV